MEVLTAVFLCLSVVVGAAYGWFASATVLALAGGAVIFGMFGLLLASLIALAADLVSGFIKRISRR